jgi:hypothetical protein
VPQSATQCTDLITVNIEDFKFTYTYTYLEIFLQPFILFTGLKTSEKIWVEVVFCRNTDDMGRSNIPTEKQN